MRKKYFVLIFLLFLPYCAMAQALSGTYHIGTSQPAPFKTITSAIARINASGVSGPVTFLLDDSNYSTKNGEIFPIVITQFTGSSATNTLTIKPNAGNTVVIENRNTGEGSKSVFKIIGAKFVIFDGNNGSSSKALTVKNNSMNHTLSKTVFWLGDNASNIQIKNLAVQQSFSLKSNLSIGVFAGNGSTVSKLSTGNNPNNTIENVNFIDAKHLLFINGKDEMLNVGWKILNNTNSTTNGNNKPFFGLYVNTASNFSILNNTISDLSLVNTDYDEYGFTFVAGIAAYGSNGIVANNQINKIVNSLMSSSFGLLSSGNRMMLNNNVISDVVTSGGGDLFSQSGFGIFLSSGEDIKVYHNSVRLGGVQKLGLSAAIFVGTNTTKLDIRNNNFINAQTGGSKKVAFYSEWKAKDKYLFLDFNNYYSTQYVAGWGDYYESSNLMTTLEDWKKVIGKETNAKNIQPDFVLNTTLRLKATAKNFDLQGVLLDAVSTDIDGQPRSKPYIGADEIVCFVQPGAINGNATQCALQTGLSYSVAAVANATSYNWTVPPGWIITSGQGTNTIRVTAGAGGQNGFIRVTAAVVDCGISAVSALPVTVNSYSVAPTDIIGETTIYAGNSTTLAVSGGSAGTGATAQWFADACEGTVIGTGNSITVSPLRDSTYFVRYSGSCNTTSCISVKVTVSPLPPTVLPPMPVEPVVISGCNTNGSITLLKQEQAIFFDKSKTQLVYTNLKFPSVLPSFTMEGWVKFKTSDLNSGYTGLFGQKGILRFGFQADVLFLHSYGGYLSIPVGNLGDNEWHHIATVGDGAKTMLFIDGVLKKSLPQLTSNYGGDSSNEITIAGDIMPEWDCFKGQMMKVGFYTTALSLSEIKRLASSPTTYLGTEKGLLAGYNFNETSGAILKSVPSGVAADLVNSPIWQDPYTYIWSKTGDASFSSSTRDIKGLSSGVYNLSFYVRSGFPREVSYDLSKYTKISTWKEGKWSVIPTSDSNLIIADDYTSTSNLNGCVCTVNEGVTMTIKSGHTLTIVKEVTTKGKLILENNASLVQTTNAKNSGAIEYRRTSSPMKNFDYTYWSSPVIGQTAKLLSPNTLWDKYHKYDPLKGWVNDDGLMAPGVGFIIRTPKPGVYGAPYPETVAMPYKQPVAFKGIPNNGDYEFKVGADQYNLIGNPYPSAIDAKRFMETNKDIIHGALYFWTHNTAITNNDYQADDYATFNITGGTGTAASKANTGGVAPKGFIAAGQSFFVGNTAAGSFKFTNAMRVSGNNSQFFNLSKNLEVEVEKHRVWLNLTNSGGAFKQLLVGYISGATNDFDNLYDGPSFDGQEFVDFYSVNKGQNLTIQGRALPFSDKDEVPLGYRSTIEGTFNISIDHRDGALAGQEIWLEDKETNAIHDLSRSDYSFTAIKGVENDRFVLKYYNNQLGTEDNVLEDKKLIVSVKNKIITINSSGEAIEKVQIFDLLGRKLYDKSKINEQKWSIASLRSSKQVLIVRTTLANGAVKSNKIIF
ncbi:Concanavalin A-like lectin/glucanases superfamily protein [Flavobacterium succinicans]|uniref:Concanavalin A-like lectin/glucanases superfamily protein n=1 Tax=Flavobacterium succinicans TaxID=29536 RepID=A0A1I4V8I6_9FLAO|nr:T9SS sorting signal type C domain-containing protein [Flavobacterium succinicans]SFM97507.1 Concanavalin A-like lectin/glucanases superfamily protein [Flavobacterium succinicans]